MGASALSSQDGRLWLDSKPWGRKARRLSSGTTKRKGRPLRRHSCIIAALGTLGCNSHQYRMQSSVPGDMMSFPVETGMGVGGRMVPLIRNGDDVNGDGPCLKQFNRSAAAC